MRTWLDEELANTVWSFASLGQSDEKLFVALARAEWRVCAVKSQGMLPISWGRWWGSGEAS